MNTLEMMDSIQELRKQAQAILEKGIAEKRMLNEEEENEYNKLLQEIKAKEAELEELKAKLEKIKPEEKEENNSNVKVEEKRSMKNFSLLKAINDIANNRNLDETAQEVVKQGITEMRKAGQSFGGQIVLPVEKRTISVEDNAETVSLDVTDILLPLRANSVLAKAGVTFMTGLSGNVTIPNYGGSNVGWAGELDEAADGADGFGSAYFSPNRLTAYVDVSKQFLIQQSETAEQLLRNDLANAISEKIEKTVFGNQKTSMTTPGGLFEGIAADTTDLTYSALTQMEADLENNNVNNYVWIVNPTAKAQLKSTTISGTKSDIRPVLVDGEIDGIPVYSSSAVVSKGIVAGDFSEYVVAQWGGVDIVVDPYTKASAGQVRLVVNAYFDCKPRRTEAFKAKIIK